MFKQLLASQNRQVALGLYLYSFLTHINSAMLEQIFSPFWRSRRRWLYGLVAVISAFSFSVATPKPGYSASWLELLLRGIQIIQLSNISDNQEVDLGKRINQQISRQVPISRNQQLTSYINEIGQNLAANSTRPNIPYTFQVVNDKSINAFATMGGFVYMHTGLINAADNEAELASVVAHEIAHVVARHAVNQMKDSAIQQGILSAAGLDRSQAVQIGVQLALGLPNSRSDEFEADELGLDILTKTGYAPIGAVNFMKKLQQMSSGAPPEFLSTHPNTGERAKRLEEMIPSGTAYQGFGLDGPSYKNLVNSLS